MVIMMECPHCKNTEEIETAAMMLVMGQIGADEKMLILHTCKCGHQWRGQE